MSFINLIYRKGRNLEWRGGGSNPQSIEIEVGCNTISGKNAKRNVKVEKLQGGWRSNGFSDAQVSTVFNK